MSEHTPVPWEGFPPQDPTMIKTVFGYPGMDDSERSPITFLGSGVKRKANAEFIIRACNAHDDLLGALKQLSAALDEFDFDPALQAAARAAIANAEGRS